MMITLLMSVHLNMAIFIPAETKKKTATPVCSCRSMMMMMINMMMNMVMNKMMIIILTKTLVAPVCASTHEEVHGVARTESLPLQCRFNIIGDWNDQYCVLINYHHY